jgi:hypothetical protein
MQPFVGSAFAQKPTDTKSVLGLDHLLLGKGNFHLAILNAAVSFTLLSNPVLTQTRLLLMPMAPKRRHHDHYGMIGIM